MDALVDGADLSLAAAASSDGPVDGSDLSLAAASSGGHVEGADLSVAAASSAGGLAVTSAAVPEVEGGPGPDFLSDLSDDLLVSILLLVSDGDLFTLAARTMLLCRRWRSLWVKLPTLKFVCSSAHDLTRVHAALAARARAGFAPPIGNLSISYSGRAAPYPTATWLSLAPPVLSGELHFKDFHTGQAPLPLGMPGRRGEFELLLFKKTTKICLRLGFLDLTLPSSGVFYALRVLSLECVQLSEQLMLTESSFPSLRRLHIAKSHGLLELDISLKNLIWLNLSQIRGLQLLHVDAHRLEMLGVISTLRWNLQEANITVDMLKELRWADPYREAIVKLSKMDHLEKLYVLYFYPYGRYGADDINLDRLRIFKYFSRVHHIELAIIIDHDLTYMHSRMSSLNRLPCMENLSLILSVHGHVIGPTVVHLLKMCTQIRKLSLTLTECFEVQNACPLNCICDQPPSWRVQNDLHMKLLNQVEFFNFRGKTDEFDLLKLLFSDSVAPALRCMEINCHHSYLDIKKIFEDLGPFASQHTSLNVTCSPLHP